MQFSFRHTPNWSTSSDGDSPDTSPMELSELGEHLDLCQRAQRRWFAWQCAARSALGFVTARFVTTLVLAAALLIGVGALLS